MGVTVLSIGNYICSRALTDSRSPQAPQMQSLLEIAVVNRLEQTTGVGGRIYRLLLSSYYVLCMVANVEGHGCLS